MWQQIKEIYEYREMLSNLVAKELRARYKASVFGFLWTFLNPLLMLVVYSIVFAFITKSNISNYAMFLFVALLPWNYLSQSVLQGASSLVANAGLIKKVYFPRSVLPLSIVIANLFNYLFSLAILIPALLLSGVHLTVALLAFPAVLVSQTLFVTAVAFLIAIGNVYFRDLEHIVSVLVMAWFFLTPVLYSIDIIPPKVQLLFKLNPATGFIESYRRIFFTGMWPNWLHLLYLTIGGSLLLLFSFFVFLRLQRRVAEEI